MCGDRFSSSVIYHSRMAPNLTLKKKKKNSHINILSAHTIPIQFVTLARIFYSFDCFYTCNTNCRPSLSHRSSIFSRASIMVYEFAPPICCPIFALVTTFLLYIYIHSAVCDIVNFILPIAKTYAYNNSGMNIFLGMCGYCVCIVLTHCVFPNRKVYKMCTHKYRIMYRRTYIHH